MKKLSRFVLYVSILTAFLHGCRTQTHVAEVQTVSRRYENLNFHPKQIEKQSREGLVITITPIDAAIINRETFESASRDGSYEKEFTLQIERRSAELSGLSDRQRVFLQGQINALEAIDMLERRGEITSLGANQLRNRIWNGEEYGLVGTEVEKISAMESYPDLYNPYKINQRFLSVFRVTFENKGSEVEQVRLSDFQIISNEEMTFPYGLEYFENNLNTEGVKYENAYRMNMPNELVVSPFQRITKYIAVPALNPRNENLVIQLIRDNQVVNFNFDVKQEVGSRNYQLEAYQIIPSANIHSPSNRAISNHNVYFAVIFENGPSFAAKSSKIFVNQEFKNSPATIHMIAINTSTSIVTTAVFRNFKFEDQDENRVVVQI